MENEKLGLTHEKVFSPSNLQLDDVAPARRGIAAAMVVTDGVGKDVSLARAVLRAIHLRAEHHRLAALHPVDAVHHSVQTLHLLQLLRSDVEEVQLHRTVGECMFL